MIQPLRDLPYHARLCQLNLPSLAYRRRRGDMILIYQITHQLLKISFPAFFTPSLHASTRGHNYKLLKSQYRCRPRQSFFSVRSINDWNSLPANIVNATSLNQFKNLLDEHWNNQLFN